MEAVATKRLYLLSFQEVLDQSLQKVLSKSPSHLLLSIPPDLPKYVRMLGQATFCLVTIPSNPVTHLTDCMAVGSIPVIIISSSTFLFITMAMYQATTEDDNHNDPAGAFAKSYLWTTILGYYSSNRKVIILISTPITFLLGAVLLALRRGTTALRMILSGLISLGVGIFFCLFSVDTIQLIILLGSNMSSLIFNILKLLEVYYWDISNTSSNFMAQLHLTKVCLHLKALRDRFYFSCNFCSN